MSVCARGRVEYVRSGMKIIVWWWRLGIWAESPIGSAAEGQGVGEP